MNVLTPKRKSPARTPGIYRLGDCSGTPYGSLSCVSGASAFVRIKTISRLPGSSMPAMAPTSERAAETPIAGANPSLNAWAEPKLPTPANTAARIATPNAPPSWRSMLNVPDALPISLAATALTTAFWVVGIAIEAPQPAMISGATSSA